MKETLKKKPVANAQICVKTIKRVCMTDRDREYIILVILVQ